MKHTNLPPTLERLGNDLEQAFLSREAADRAVRSRRRRRLVIATAAGALMLVPVAIATRSLWESGPSQDRRAAVVTRGEASGVQWRLSAYGDDGRLCMRLTVSGGRPTQSTACQPASTDGKLDVRIAPSDNRTFVFGAAPPNAVDVKATLSGDPVATSRPVSLPESSLERAEIDGSPRFYLLVIDRPIEPDAPLRVVAADSAGNNVAEHP
jgi:hypothetical protein